MPTSESSSQPSDRDSALEPSEYEKLGMLDTERVRRCKFQANGIFYANCLRIRDKAHRAKETAHSLKVLFQELQDIQHKTAENIFRIDRDQTAALKALEEGKKSKADALIEAIEEREQENERNFTRCHYLETRIVRMIERVVSIQNSKYVLHRQEAHLPDPE